MADREGNFNPDFGYTPFTIGDWNTGINVPSDQTVSNWWNGLWSNPSPAYNERAAGWEDPALSAGNDATSARYAGQAASDPTVPVYGNSNNGDSPDAVDRNNSLAYQMAVDKAAADKAAAARNNGQGTNFGGFGGSGGGISAYQQALLEIERQKLADARAQAQARLEFDNRQADMKKQYDESQSIDTFDKNFRDYQSKHYYGGMYGPGYFSPGGAAQAYRAPEPYYVEQYYKDHPEAGADPFSQAPTYAGYSGSQYFSPQHPGMAAAMSAPVGSAGQASGATNPLPYGPELTGESGLGASITQNGTPVALSAWQRSHLDPTSLEHYNSYVGDIAGADPNDFKSYTQQESGNVASLKAPTSFSYAQ